MFSTIIQKHLTAACTIHYIASVQLSVILNTTQIPESAVGDLLTVWDFLKTFGSVIGVHAPTLRELHDAVIAMSRAAVEEHTTSSSSSSNSSAKVAAATTGTDSTKQDDSAAAAAATDATTAVTSKTAAEAIETVAEQDVTANKTNDDDSMDVSETTTAGTADNTADTTAAAAPATTAGAAASSDSKANDNGKANSSSIESVAPQCVTSIAARALLSSLHLALLRSVLGRETNGAPNRQVVRAFEMLTGVRESLGEVLNAATWPEVSMLIAFYCLE
jgi:DDT domain